MMLQTAQALSQLQLHSIKIHLLHLLKGTRMAEEYARGEFELLSREEYVQIVCDQLELESLIGPMWSLKKLVVMNEIDKELARRDSWQGRRFSPAHV